MRHAVCATKPMGMAGAGARVWRSARQANSCDMAAYGFMSIPLTHKATVRPEGPSGGTTG